MSNSSPSILSVLSHPADESFYRGGTVALYARKGYNLYLFCATHDELAL